MHQSCLQVRIPDISPTYQRFEELSHAYIHIISISPIEEANKVLPYISCSSIEPLELWSDVPTGYGFVATSTA